MRHSRATYYLEGFDREELSADQRTKLDAHLSGCSSCAARADKAADLDPLRELFATSMTPPGFEEAIERVRRSTLRAVRDGHAGQVRWVPSWVLGLARPQLAVPVLAAAALLLFLLVAPSREGSTRFPLPTQTAMVAPHARDFRVLRNGSEVTIEWARNGRASHSVRKGTDPVTVKVAGGEAVRGKVWRDAEKPTPGVTYYWID